MMKCFRTFFLSSFLMAVLIGHAQFDDQNPDNFKPEEIALKECSFDKGADAIVFFDKAISNYNDQYNLITSRRIRIKILKEKGIGRGDIRIPYYSRDNFETIGRIKGMVGTPSEDGSLQITRLENKSIFRRKINDYYSEVSFALPNVKVGSIIEYEYESTMTHYGGLEDWYFQWDIPVVLSSYELYIVPNAEFTYFVRKNNFMPVKVEPDPRNGRVYFEMREIPGLRDESYSTSYRDYLQRIDFQLSAVSRNGSVIKYTTTWKEMTKEFLDDKDFGGQLSKNLPGTDLIKILLAKTTSPYEKMMLIHHYVRESIGWNGIRSKYAVDGLKTVMEKKKGNNAEMNLLLINLLRSADIAAYPLLVSERSHGKVDSTYCFKDQFSKVVAYVPLDGKKYILDASDPYTPTDMVPFELLNTVVYIVDQKNDGFVKIEDEGKKRSYIVNILSAVDKSAFMNGKASVDYYDYARIGQAEKYKRNKGGYVEEFLKASPAVRVDSFAIDNLESDSLALNHHFILSQPLNKSGSYYLLNYNLFTGFDKNPFVSDYRFTDVDFGSKYFFLLNNNIELPDNMVVESLPKNARIITPDNSLVLLRQVKQEGKYVTISFRIEFNASEFSVDNYTGVKDFFKKMIEALNEPVVLKSK